MQAKSSDHWKLELSASQEGKYNFDEAGTGADTYISSWSGDRLAGLPKLEYESERAGGRGLAGYLSGSELESERDSSEEHVSQKLFEQQHTVQDMYPPCVLIQNQSISRKLHVDQHRASQDCAALSLGRRRMLLHVYIEDFRNTTVWQDVSRFKKRAYLEDVILV